MLNNSGVPIVAGMEQGDVSSERYEDLKGYMVAPQYCEGSQQYERYDQEGANMATLPMRRATSS